MPKHEEIVITDDEESDDEESILTSDDEEEEDCGDEEMLIGDEFDEDDEDDEDFMDMGSLLSSLLSTAEGDNVCTALVKINNTLQQQMDTQNKILLKIYSELKNKTR